MNTNNSHDVVCFLRDYNFIIKSIATSSIERDKLKLLLTEFWIDPLIHACFNQQKFVKRLYEEKEKLLSFIESSKNITTSISLHQENKSVFKSVEVVNSKWSVIGKFHTPITWKKETVEVKKNISDNKKVTESNRVILSTLREEVLNSSLTKGEINKLTKVVTLEENKIKKINTSSEVKKKKWILLKNRANKERYKSINYDEAKRILRELSVIKDKFWIS